MAEPGEESMRIGQTLAPSEPGAHREGFTSRPLEPGDQVEVEVEGIGVLTNEVMADGPLRTSGG
jgi:2-keto-4-pentenoate hydratase/2-oxohepta-3-ene-1,7-dioic acid hydratase in catechol pathway